MIVCFYHNMVATSSDNPNDRILWHNLFVTGQQGIGFWGIFRGEDRESIGYGSGEGIE